MEPTEKCNIQLENKHMRRNSPLLRETNLLFRYSVCDFSRLYTTELSSTRLAREVVLMSARCCFSQCLVSNVDTTEQMKTVSIIYHISLWY